MNDAKKTDPQSWNAYTYVYNHPLILVDRDGKGVGSFFQKLKNLMLWNMWATNEEVQKEVKTSDPRAGDPVAELKLTIKAVLHAIQSYNREHQHPISTIGFWTREIGINRMDVSTAGDIIRSVYEEQC